LRLFYYRYLRWIKNTKAYVETLRQQFNQKELLLRNHPEFHEVEEYDLALIEQFRAEAKLGSMKDEAAESVASEMPKRKGRLSIASSISSIRSKKSLDSIAEDSDGEHEDYDDGDEHSAPKRRKGSIGHHSMLSQSASGHTQSQMVGSNYSSGEETSD